MFLQASSPEVLDRLFADGIIRANGLYDTSLWVERNGAVAIVTADEASEEMAKDAGRTWISLDEDRPGES